MSDRDFIIQEIRKLFKEQEVASNPTKPAAASVEKPPKTTEKPKKQNSNEPEYLKHPSWRQKYAPITDLKQLIDKNVAMNKESLKRALQVAKIIHPKAFFNPTDRGLSVASGDSFKDNPEMNHIKNFILVSGNPIPATEEIVKYITRQDNNLPASLGGKASTPQKTEPGAVSPTGPMKKAVDITKKDPKAKAAINSAAKKEEGALATLKAANLAGKMRTDKEAHEVAAQVAANIAADAGVDKGNIYQSLSKFVGKSSTALKKAMASLDSGNFVGPMPQDGKVMSASKAQPTEDFPFQVASLPDNFPNKIVAGMDRRDPGFNKGGSKVINQAAIGILGSDPKVIYTALINSGVLPPNYSPSGAPFSDLSKHIATFQERATSGLLRYQKQMKISAQDADARLRYEPQVPTPSKRSKQLTDKEKSQLVMRPGLTEQDKPNVAVDGKIGSRTAKMLLVYADKSKFEALKTKAGVVPKPEPDVPVPSSTKTSKPTTTTKPTSTTQQKEKPKEEKQCSFSFATDDDVRVKTVLTILGYSSCDLKKFAKKYRYRKENFTDLLQFFQTVKGGRGSRAFDQRYEDKKTNDISNLGSPQAQIDVFNAITKPALQNTKNSISVPTTQLKHLQLWLDKAVSPMIFQLHTGMIGDPKVLLNFAYVKFGSDTIPLIYTSGIRSGDDVRAFTKAVKYYSWITQPPEKRKDAFQKPINLDGLISNMTRHAKNIQDFRIEGLAPAKNSPKFAKSIDVLQKADMICTAYERSLMGFLQRLQAFKSSPSEETIRDMASFGAPISLAQKKLHER